MLVAKMNTYNLSRFNYACMGAVCSYLNPNLTRPWGVSTRYAQGREYPFKTYTLIVPAKICP